MSCIKLATFPSDGNVDVTLVGALGGDWSPVIDPGSLGSVKEGAEGNSAHGSLNGLDPDSRAGSASVYASHRYRSLWSRLSFFLSFFLSFSFTPAYCCCCMFSIFF